MNANRNPKRGCECKSSHKSKRKTYATTDGCTYNCICRSILNPYYIICAKLKSINHIHVYIVLAHCRPSIYIYIDRTPNAIPNSDKKNPQVADTPTPNLLIKLKARS